jgi:hypothetical protein
MNWCSRLLLTMVMTLLPAAGALAHGPTADDILGTVHFDPPVPVAGQQVDVRIRLFYEADNHPVEATSALLEIDTGLKTVVNVTLTPDGPGIYRGSFAAPAPRDYRMFVTASVGELTIRSDSGLKVVERAGAYAGAQAVRDRGLWFRPAGARKPATWADALTWQLMVAGILTLSLLLWWRARDSASGAAAAGSGAADTRSLNPIPALLLTIAAAGGFLSIAGGYWDIAWHAGRGRESFWQPPHLLIYGGILSTMLAVGAGVAWDKARRRLDPRLAGERLRGSPALLVALIALAVQLGSAPVDEFWHATFGLDVSVWSPPHLLLIFGGMLSNLALAGAEPDEVRQGRPTAWWRMILLTAAGLGVACTFLAEFELIGVPDWHISQSRAEELYAVVLATLFPLALAVSARGNGRWNGTMVVSLVWLWRAAVLFLLLPAVSLKPLLLPPLALLPAAAAFDLVLQRQPSRYGLAGAAFAAVLFAAYLPLSYLVPAPPVSVSGLAAWFPVGAAVAAAAAYIGGRLGRFAAGDAPAVASARTA